MGLIDEQFTKTPFYGYRRMTEYLRHMNHPVNRKRVHRLMKLMRIVAIYPKKRTTINHPDHRIYPYLLRGMKITEPNQVWSTDITYIKMNPGFMYLVAVIDWSSRYVLSWELSNTLDNSFCIKALKTALKQGIPKYFNTDQGVQFTSHSFINVLKDYKVNISMDGKGRALDNVFVERLWRSVKYENIYPSCYENVPSLYRGLKKYFTFYNTERFHQSLKYNTPYNEYFVA